MLQIVSAVDQHPKLLSRGTDLCVLKGHVLRILNDMVSLIHSFPSSGPDEPETAFLLGGWSCADYDEGNRDSDLIVISVPGSA
jgi:hypothetical protein